MTKVLVTGAGGMLGSDLVAVLSVDPSFTVTAARRTDLDLLSPADVRAAVPGHDVVINAAAWTNVDGAETSEEAATALNGGAVASLASACAASGARLIHVSTDYVLSGSASSPYPESAPPAPINAYGRSKLAGEQAVLSLLPSSGYVVRTAWLYGQHGRNFAATMLRLAAARPTVNVVADQHGQPTWSLALARQLVALASAPSAPAGIYHGTAGGSTTWYGFAQAVFSLSGLDPERVRPIPSADFPLPAPRPAYSVLGHDRWASAGLAPMADWHTSLAAAVAAGAVRAG
ncbi:NAD(P)-dependent oxidoreductase [Asanoa ishikariensis]|uniref:dTDP-4-dehydrorhamnose reductase n=1 Tax=Asanoa ishikariensis TaxID=137265 RepID=A0A1H3TUT2_9ACTN|nr:dTDP-4-dehydrorhamnose reductase [Asanoa ishikariensis]GIF67390.1 NAD(P)-dependent oxidoreductase [Asanoa ishikariensis]SDZ53009.1 dTDP-4-dehydrorhamnose reductase [Asanoa ishikariensis]